MKLAPNSTLYIGLMSGTSLDGLDAVVVEFSATTTRVTGFKSTDLPSRLIQLTKELSRPGANELSKTAEVGRLWSETSAKLVSDLLDELHLNAKDIIAIGAHGQTVRHEPPSISPSQPFSLQAINASLLAELSSIDVITDFRNRDIAIGGEGAPLAPSFHNALFGGDSSKLLVNLGGIANLSWIKGDETYGFDTGPANILMDAWCERHLNKPFDTNGDWATQGTVDTELLPTLMSHPFISKPSPKSTGREEFNIQWLDSILSKFDIEPASVQATLLEFTVLSISEAIKVIGSNLSEIYLCGGGAYNGYLKERLGANLGIPIKTTEQLGIDPQQVECVGFAWLARQFTKRETGNLPKVTGARGKRILGALYPK